MLGGTALLTLSVSASGYSLVQPDFSKWLALNATIQGRLINGIPFARPCFQQAAPEILGTFNAEACETVKEHYLDHRNYAPVSCVCLGTQWETCQRTGASCLLDRTNSNNSTADTPPRVCSQGSIPQFAINVSTVQDVIAGFKFSKDTGVPLVIKNTGHDLKGRSGGPGTLSLWVHNFKSVGQVSKCLDPNSTGCQRCKSRTISFLKIAGVQFADLLTFADEKKMTIPTGGCSSIGAAGGYVPGGGHSLLSNVFGLGVDRILEYEVVTPQGDHIVVNECSHPDLFWALRGGGGGTFGVILRVSTRAFPEMSFIGALGTYDSSDVTKRRQFFQFVTNHSLELAQQGWGTYVLPGLFILANPKLALGDANTSTQSLRKFFTTILGGNFTLTLEPNYKALFDNYISLGNVATGLPLTMSSRFIPVENFQSAGQLNALSDALDSIADKVDVTSIFATTPFLFGATNNTSVNPVWRTSIWQAGPAIHPVTLANTWSFESTPSEIAKKYSELTAANDILRALTPGSGSYLNEADVYEPDHEASFWGNNYPRLLEIKKKYDPDHLLDVWHGVGWRGAQDPRYKCYI
ncbi:FAD-binding domain-containing protein [Mycena floridula]|nr:FAD-binding domain-containing protein [Mycena floridula]